MEILRTAANPWGQEVLIGVGFDLLWVAVGVGVVFMLVHTLLVLRLRHAEGPDDGTPVEMSSGAQNIPERVVRYDLASRLFHWTMAAAMFALLITAFVPVIGLQFDWVTIHWIAGLVLVATVIYHIIHAVFFQSLRSVWVGPRDIREGLSQFFYVFGAGDPPSIRSGKYPVPNKLFHHGATILTLAAAVTGVVMMVRLDTPIFQQNLYMFADATWGLIYVLHGLAGVVLVLMVMGHVYFAIRPEKWWQTRSMIRGWISREEYLHHHDPERWSPDSERGEPRLNVGAPPASGHPVES